MKNLALIKGGDKELTCMGQRQGEQDRENETEIETQRNRKRKERQRYINKEGYACGYRDILLWLQPTKRQPIRLASHWTNGP